MIRFFVAGIPKAMSVGGHHVRNPKTGAVFTTRRHEEWALVVGQVGRTYAPPKPLEGPVSILVQFWMPRPKSAPKRVVFPQTRPDVDNLMHKLTDQFNGVFWLDDAQILDQVTRRRYTDPEQKPGLEFMVVEGPLSLLVVGGDGILVQDD